MPNAYDISFTPEMEKKILDGYKVMTSRRLGFNVGYTFTIRGKSFIVVACWLCRFRTIRDLLYAAEGFSSPEELEAYFESIGYSTLPRQYYNVIVFEPVEDL